MSDRKKKKYDTGTVLSKEQFNTLESEHERNRFIDTTLTSDQQNTTIQPQSSNQQGVLLKKEVQHRPDYNDFENRKSEILWNLNSFTSKELITKKKAIEGEHVLYNRRYLWMCLCYLTVFNCLG
ncbi:unnamed protein product [Clavelina lepadiformis]|uniref:Uncharacterized protein n=1 Tax=Clavelina lepadiformis TaxID=159417 RepID=A0ABP0FNH9_CLALP